jgi:hypothetical protein
VLKFRAVLQVNTTLRPQSFSIMMYTNLVFDNKRFPEIKSFIFKIPVFTAVKHSNPLLRSSIMQHVSILLMGLYQP